MKSAKIISIWTKVLVEVLDGKQSAERKQIIARLEAILVRKKKEYLLSKILHLTLETFARRKQLDLVFAREQSKETVEKLKKKFAEYFGQEKTVLVAVDRDLVAGFIARTENQVINASARDYLKRLKEAYDLPPSN